jgi:DNA-binding CsgD family transcriptional regulator
MSALQLRLAELVTALSLATDIGSGMPMEMMLASCLASVRLGEALGLSDDELREAYYLALLRHAGCTAEAPLMAELMSDDFLARTPAYYSIKPTQPLQTMNIIWRSIVDQSKPTLERFGLFMRFLSELPQIIVAHCEVAQQLAARLNIEEGIQVGLRQMGERWDGQGFPHKLKGEAIRLPARVAQVAHDAVIIHHFFGAEADLTEREIEVLRLVARGHTNPQIAQQLTLSPKTVSRHLESIYSKIGVSTRSAATYFAMHHGLA